MPAVLSSPFWPLFQLLSAFSPELNHWSQRFSVPAGATYSFMSSQRPQVRRMSGWISSFKGKNKPQRDYNVPAPTSNHLENTILSQDISSPLWATADLFLKPICPRVHFCPGHVPCSEPSLAVVGPYQYFSLKAAPFKARFCSRGLI